MADYSYNSDKYYIPAAQEGDYFDDGQQKRIVDTIDRVLKRIIQTIAPNRVGKGVVAEGNFTGLFVSNNSKVSLSPSSEQPSLFAFADDVPIYSLATESWTGLTNNETYYLYAKLIENTAITPADSSRWYGDFECVAYTSAVEADDLVFIATAVTTGSAISITTNPTGKIYIRNVADYDSDYDGVIDNAKNIDSKSLAYILNRANQTGLQDWLTIDTDTNKVSTSNLITSERASLRLYEAFGNYWVSGDIPSTSTSLAQTIPEQIVAISGLRIVLASCAGEYIADRDTYVDIGPDGELDYNPVSNDATAPTVEDAHYRLFKVVSKGYNYGTGTITIQRRPSVNDIVTIYGTDFTVVATEGEVVAGNEKFWIGSADTTTGYSECASSLKDAINNASPSITATAAIGTSTNAINITATVEGLAGNQVITKTITIAGDITVTGISDGHEDYLEDVVDYRKTIIPYWKNPVETFSSLPATGVNGEERLVLDENINYRYSTDKELGTGSITVLQIPTHGEKIYAGGITLTASSGETDLNKKEFEIGATLETTAYAIRDVLRDTSYPTPKVTALVAGSRVNLTTKGLDTYYYNETIELLNGTASHWSLSGISNTNETEGWVAVGDAASAGTAVLDITKEAQTSILGQTDFNLTNDFNADSLFTFRNGVYQEEGVLQNYQIVSTSGIKFNEGLLDNERVDTYILELSSGLQAAISSSASSDLTYVTVEPEATLPNSLDVEGNSTFHVDINHDASPISDPGSRYTHDKTYSVISDHIFDVEAHTPATAYPAEYAVQFPFIMQEAETAQNFRLQASAYKDFRTTVTDSKSSLSVTGYTWEFYSLDSTVPGWGLKYDSDASTINGMQVYGSYIFAAGNNGKVFRGDISGLTWVEDGGGLDLGAGVNCFEEENNTLYAGLDNGELWARASSGVSDSWALEATSSGTTIKSLNSWNGNLHCGVDGEVYEYDVILQQWVDDPIIDVPVQYVTALETYGGFEYVGTENPFRVYRYDNSGVTLDFSGAGLDYGVNDLEAYAGKIFAGTGNRGIVYEKSGTGAWSENHDFVPDNVNSLFYAPSYGYMYAGLSNGELWRYDNVTWTLETDTPDVSSIYSITESAEHLYIGTSLGKVYKKVVHRSTAEGWSGIPITGLSDEQVTDNRIRLVVTEGKTFNELGIKYIRYNQNDGLWRYAYYIPGYYDTTDTCGRNVLAEIIKSGSTGNTHFQFQASPYKNFTHMLVNSQSKDGQTNWAYTTNAAPGTWSFVPEPGVDPIDAGCRVRYTSPLDVGLDKFTNMYTRYRQWDSGIQAYGDWYYNANGYVVKAYDFFTSNSNVSTIIDGFRTISDDELIDSVRVHAITAPDSGITLDVNKCSSSGNTFSSIFGDQDLRPALESGITAATFTGMSITSLIQDDLVSVDIDISNDSAANVGISLRTIEFTN